MCSAPTLISATSRKSCQLSMHLIRAKSPAKRSWQMDRCCNSLVHSPCESLNTCNGSWICSHRAPVLQTCWQMTQSPPMWHEQKRNVLLHSWLLKLTPPSLTGSQSAEWMKRASAPTAILLLHGPGTKQMRVASSMVTPTAPLKLQIGLLFLRVFTLIRSWQTGKVGSIFLVWRRLLTQPEAATQTLAVAGFNRLALKQI